MRVQAILVKGQEVVGFAFVAAVQASTSGEPGHGAFDGPTVAAEPLRSLDASAGDAVLDASAGQPPSQVAAVIALVGVELGGPSAARSAARADGRDAAHERFEGLTVVQVRAGDSDRKGQSGPLGDHRACCENGTVD